MNWITHTPGDPIPCDGSTKILVLLSTGFTSKTPMKAKQWLWGRCGDTSVVGWQYADLKPTETIKQEHHKIMNPIDQQIALALHMGYKFDWQPSGTLLVITPSGTVIQRSDPHGRTKEQTIIDCTFCLPDYLGDLNAVAVVENSLGTLRLQEYGKQLQEVTCWHCVGVVPDYRRDLVHLARVARAKAPQRCEAILKTLGLWTE